AGLHACACPARIARQTGNSAGNCTRKSPERSFGRHDGALFNSLLEALDDYVTDTNPVRVVDVFAGELDLQKLGFDGVEPALTGRPTDKSMGARVGAGGSPTSAGQDA
ncbi:hypothetical protein FSB64_41940, partial [Paraburkholderia sp. JPY454]|nr:hypothetical protein [Paraburkholderia youngii]